MSEICEDCGLPRDLCQCKELDKENKRLAMHLEDRTFHKKVTVIEGFGDTPKSELEDLARTLKKMIGTGGTVKNGKIELQGDRRDIAPQILYQKGWKMEK